MNQHQIQQSDPLIDQVREARRQLIREHGNLEGRLKHLQERQEQHPEKVVSRPRQAAD